MSVLPEANLFLSAANMFISKKNFKQLNGFDPELTDAEDYDLAVRAAYAGIKIVFSPKNIGFHFSFLSFKAYILRQREDISASRKLLEVRRNAKLKNLYLKYNVKKSPIKSILYACLPVQLVHWMDQGKFKFLPISATRYSGREV